MTIFGIEGGIGSGKTMTLVKYGLDDLYKGKKLFSNVKLNVDKKYNKMITYLDKDKIKDIFEHIKSGKFDMRNATVLLQEAHNYMDSRTSLTVKNRTLTYWILQSRHTGAGSCDIIYDTQELGQIDKRLRNNTDFVCRPMIVEKFEDGTPVTIGVVLRGKLGQKFCKFYEEYDASKILNKYDTHEIVDF